MAPLAYKSALPETLSRLRSLYERQAADRIFAVMDVANRTLAEFQERYGDAYQDYTRQTQRLVPYIY